MQAKQELPHWRSLMFVPANVQKYVDKAAGYGADALMLDLEDSVGAADKESARRALPAAIRALAGKGADIAVRINRPLELAVRDIEAAVCPEVGFLMLPKIDSVGHVRLLAELVETCEYRLGMEIGHTRFYPVVEHVKAFPHMFEIAAAHPRVVAFTCGTEDFSASAGSLPDRDVLQFPKQQGVFAARAAGVLALGLMASPANFRDMAAYREAVLFSRRFGVEGSACIHPAQVAVLNECFTPSAAEVAKAQAVVSTYDEALAVGRGSVGLEGMMLDVPIVERAQRVLYIAERCAQRQRGKERSMQ